jgi:hypothetical protein
MLVRPQQFISAHNRMGLSHFPIEELIADVGRLVLRTLLHGQVLCSNHLHFKRIQVMAVDIAQQRLIRNQSEGK